LKAAQPVVHDGQEALDAVTQRLIGPAGSHSAAPRVEFGPEAYGALTDDDKQLLVRARADEKFERAWTNTTAPDQSKADFALMCCLVRHVGNDPDRLYRLFTSEGALGQREKAARNADRTITAALTRVQEEGAAEAYEGNFARTSPELRQNGAVPRAAGVTAREGAVLGSNGRHMLTESLVRNDISGQLRHFATSPIREDLAEKFRPHSANGRVRHAWGQGTRPPRLGERLPGAVTGVDNPALRQLRQTTSPSGEVPPEKVKWLDFDFEALPERPDYVVDGLIERGTTNAISADSGVGKSWVSEDLIVAIVSGRTWLGRELTAQRVLVVDEENPSRMVRGRLRALGMKNEHRDALLYASQAGVVLGDPEWNKWLLEQVKQHRADVIIIDTAMAATNVPDVNDNSAVTALFRVLKPIAKETGAAIILLHHERKVQLGEKRDSGQAMIGARAWSNGLDTHLALARDSQQADDLPDGTRSLQTVVTMYIPKLRDEVPGSPERVVVSSEKAPEGWLRWAKVESEGPTKGKQSRAEALAARMGEALADGPLKSADLAAAVDEKSDAGSFNRARKLALDEGYIIKLEKFGTYQAGPNAPPRI